MPGRRRKVKRGGSVLSVLKKINAFAKKNKLVSNAAELADQFGVPYAAKVGRVARKVGYGKKGARKKLVFNPTS